jgi:hypothetical protein
MGSLQVLETFRESKGQPSEPQAIATIMCSSKPGSGSALDVALNLDHG